MDSSLHSTPEDELLSCLSQIADLSRCDEVLLTCAIKNGLSSSDVTNSVSIAIAWKHLLASETAINDVLFEKVRQLVRQLSPFDLHAAVGQALFVVDDAKDLTPTTNSYLALLFALAGFALSQAPTPLVSRRKRWRSLVFETLQWFQRTITTTPLNMKSNMNENIDNSVIVDIWIHIVAPATRAVKLDDDMTPYLACLGAIGTRLAQRNFERASDILKSLKPHYNRVAFLWMHPYRMYHYNHDNSSLFQSQMAGWINEEKDPEAVCYCKTSWSELGLAVLGNAALKDRPLVYSHAYVWKLWFPFVAPLLNANVSIGEEQDNDDEAACSDAMALPFQQLGYSMLEELLFITPKACLLSPRRGDKVPDCPVGTLQLLSNRILHSGDPQEETATATTAYALMKRVLDKFASELYQATVIRELVITCPYDHVRPKLLDMFRVMVHWTSAEAIDLVWDYIDTYALNPLEQQGNLAELMLSVETYDAALGLLNLWLLVRKSCPAILDLESRIQSIHSYLLQRSHNLESFRCNLLELSIQQIQERLAGLNKR
jgi:hypothetical protein